MRYGILSDIHGHAANLQRAICLLKEHGAERIVCLGDVLGKSGNNVSCLDQLFSEKALIVMGNHDRLGYSYLPAQYAKKVEKAFAQRIELEGITFSHTATCRRCQYGALPWNNRRLDSIEKAADQLAMQEAFISFVGHTHSPSLYESTPSDKMTRAFALDMELPFLLDRSAKYCCNPGAITDVKDIKRENPHMRMAVLPPPSCALYDADKATLRFLGLGGVI